MSPFLSELTNLTRLDLSGNQLTNLTLPAAEDEKILQVHEALETLSVEDPEKARIVKLRFFVGLSNEEIAALLRLNEKTVRRHWEVAKVRLFQNIKAQG